MAKRVIVDIDPSCDLETSWVKRGSNPMSKVFLKKSADEPQPENLTMALKSVIVTTTAASAVGKAFLESLTKEEELDTFVAKTDAERAAVLADFAKAKSMPMEPDEDDKPMKKAAETPPAAPSTADLAALISKALDESPVVKSLREENESLKKRLEDGVTKSRETELRKSAETTYAGIGKSADEMVSVLKGLDTLDEPVRKHVEDIFKAHAELTKKVARTVGFTPIIRAGSAADELDMLVKEVAKSEKLSYAAAMRKVSEDPAHTDLVERADAEEHQAAA